MNIMDVWITKKSGRIFVCMKVPFISHDRKGLTCTVKECYTLLAKREDGKDEYNRCMNHQKIRQCMHQGCNMMSCRAVVHIGANKKKYNYPGMPLQGPGQFWSLCKAWWKEVGSEKILQSWEMQKNKPKISVCVLSMVQRWNVAALRGAPTRLWREEYVEIIGHLMTPMQLGTIEGVGIEWGRGH